MNKKHLIKGGKLDGDFFFCVVLIIVACLLLFISSTTIKIDENSLGPFFWPKTILIGLLIGGVIKLILHVWKWRKPDTQVEIESKPNYRPLILSVVITFVYFLGVTLIGYPIASLFFVAAISCLGGIRNIKLLGYVSVGLTLVTSFLFVGVMYISLPRGVWIFFDITNWFFSLIKF